MALLSYGVARAARPDSVEVRVMKKVLYMLGEFTDQDMDWLIEVGQRDHVPEGEVLIREGELVENIFFVLQGHFVVSVREMEEIARIGDGEIIGELSFLDSRPPNATVTAQEDSVVMVVPKSRIDGRLRTDTAFSSRFYRGLGLLLADRLRDSVSQFAYGNQQGLSSGEDSRELSPELLDQLDLSARQFERIRRGLLD